MLPAVIARPLAFYTGAVCLATLLAYGGRWSWACELLVNFRTHFALLLCLALVLAVSIRGWRIAGIAAAGLALNVWPMYRVFQEPAAPVAADARAVRVVAFNVNVGNGDFAGIDRYLASLDPDVVVLEEITVWSVDQLAPILPKLPHRYRALDDGVRGIVILSRWPLIAPQLVTLEGRLFGARVDVDLGERRFRLYGVHLNWPVFPAAERIRNAQLVTLGQELLSCPGACVVVGDFNVTPWSSHYRDLLEIPGVRDCAAGRGWLPTWHSGLPAVLRIRIDQCIAGGTMGVAEVRVGEAVGSDHFATINDLLVRGSRPTKEIGAEAAPTE